MSTCPNMELHSAFLDGEIANPWYDEIKTHVEACPDCKAHVERLQSIRDAFAADSAALNLDKTELDASYELLKSRLRYKKVCSLCRCGCIPCCCNYAGCKYPLTGKAAFQ